MTTLPLFDPRPVTPPSPSSSFAASIEAQKQEDPSAAEPRFADGTSVLRIVTHHYGTFLHLREGQEPREYVLLVLQDGRVLQEFTDTKERVKSRFSRDEVEQGIREKKFREVTR